MTFYDAMLTDVTTDERMDAVSSSGFAWGYVGSTIPFMVCIALIFAGPSVLGLDTLTCTRICFIITALWWLAFTVPLLRTYRQRFGKERDEGVNGVMRNIENTFKGLADTMRSIMHDRALLVFMVAFFFYIDGVHTVISMATSYGAALGIDSTQLVLALLVTQFVAFPSAIIYGKLAGRVGTLRMIIVAVAAYVGIVLFAAFFLKSAAEFWILAVLVGMFQGGVQALSRSYFGRLIPKPPSSSSPLRSFGSWPSWWACSRVASRRFLAATSVVSSPKSAPTSITASLIFSDVTRPSWVLCEYLL